MLILTKLVEEAIETEHYTSDGKRVMLSLESLVNLGLVDISTIDQLKYKLNEWNERNVNA